MTNAEKYRTADERAKAFGEWCNKKRGCKKCVLFDKAVCSLHWLDLEAEEEKPLPCPGCGNERMHVHDEIQDPKTYMVCPECGYRAPWGMNIGAAVKRHNSIARAAVRPGGACSDICGR